MIPQNVNAMCNDKIEVIGISITSNMYICVCVYIIYIITLNNIYVGNIQNAFYWLF